MTLKNLSSVTNRGPRLFIRYPVAVGHGSPRIERERERESAVDRIDVAKQRALLQPAGAYSAEHISVHAAAASDFRSDTAKRSTLLIE